MAGKLESVLKEMFDTLGRGDAEELIGHFSEEPQGIDELSKAWMRGREALSDYLGGMLTQVSDVKSEISDFHEVILGDVGLATFWLEQDYVLGGEKHHISAPSSAVLRQEEGEWKVVLFHSIPLSD
jgi:ketosteroid isomerase-like protein